MTGRAFRGKRGVGGAVAGHLRPLERRSAMIGARRLRRANSDPASGLPEAIADDGARKRSNFPKFFFSNLIQKSAL